MPSALIPRALRGMLREGGRLLEAPARRVLRLDERSLVAAAERRARCSGFGAPAVHEPLGRLLESLAGEAQLNLMGRIAAREDLTRMLSNRLALERDRHRHPEIAAEEIRRPLVIAGLPRSGSTLLFNLLAQDPANRVPRNWETMYPSPPPEASTHESDPRIAMAERQIRWFGRLQPEFRKIHPVAARLPEECVVILSHTFYSFQFSSMFFVPSYQAWLDRQDLRPAYDFHRRFLQHLQWRCRGERWVLKAPPHLPALDALFAVYPDAGLILTHRNPLEVVASVASLHAVLRRAFSYAVDPAAVGPEVSAMLANDIARGMAALDRGCVPPGRIVNVWYADLLHDPLATVRRIYAHFELPLGPEAEARMRRLPLATARSEDGRHHYSLEQFGLDAETERRRYRAYCERFGLAGEAIARRTSVVEERPTGAP
jgi:hypothetical protein